MTQSEPASEYDTRPVPGQYGPSYMKNQQLEAKERRGGKLNAVKDSRQDHQ